MKAQTSVEFLVTLAFVLIVFIVFAITLNQQSTGLAQEQQQNELTTIGDIINQQVLTASQVHDQYSSTFELPLTLRGGAYTIITQGDEVTIRGEEQYVVYLVTNISGSIAPGKNSITKINGDITITPG